MFSINSTVTRANGVRKNGTLIPNLDSNVVYVPYRGLENVRPGTLFMFLNRYDPVTTMKEIYKLNDSLIEQVMSKLTYSEGNPNRASATFETEFDYAPSKPGPNYSYTGHGFYSDQFNGNIVPMMYHWIAYDDNNEIVERFIRVTSDIVDDKQRYRRTSKYSIPDDVVVHNSEVSNLIMPSFESSVRGDKLFKHIAGTVSALSPICDVHQFHNVISRLLDTESPNLRNVDQAVMDNCKSIMNAIDHYKHYFA